MSNVVRLHEYTKLDIDPNNVLTGAINKCEHVLVLGWDNDEEFYSASSTSNIGENLRLVELFKFKLFNGDYG